MFRLIQLMLVAFILLNGCSTADINHKQSANREHFAVSIAKGEAQRRGWKRVQVENYFFRDGFWWVYVYRTPLKLTGNDAWVQVSPDGTVIDFRVNQL